ncbi:PDDEXK nuclease domain-containing protein [Fibrobacter intestinalis]|uniref:Predicted nuclease of restriction endonuclease-like (RecB) superfamily, DUF1016 family n=1 Tax=Fibrobacter intestinalis TaxID=28122 RepID=A0A1T4MTT0_9BACT|nr:MULTISPECIES: PDDEXK nuclease domain-containing protein [Fibrobacter]PBC73123.1 putative nuclease of restriction endonuclease-like (RecB) superfamily [Fibrobacter sp. NR9]SJZ70175.1 Predicted nuclease of restriction endonuclease-like (RecB) superfamily, DUF1016 family [Fibrobacter intestinalis]
MANEIEYKKTENLLEDAKVIIESAQKFAYSAINFAIIQRNWLLGKRIAEENLHGEKRASYGKQVIKKLSKELTDLYGKGFDASNLYKYFDFYQTFPNLDTLRLNSLSWSHYRILLQVENAEARSWYEKEAAAEIWSTRTLQRNVSSQYYERTLLSQHKELVKSEMQELTKPLQRKLEFIKNPVVTEFLGLSQNNDFTESKLESAIISNIQKFLMELGKGYAFVARQQHIHTEKEDYYIDLVFYNYILKCFVLIDLKTSKITHQDVGQMDMYVRMYDELKRSDGDNPTFGIILCSDTDDDIAKYSILHGNEKLFASKYKLYLPDEERLKAEIEAQKEIFRLQHNTNN